MLKHNLSCCRGIKRRSAGHASIENTSKRVYIRSFVYVCPGACLGAHEAKTSKSTSLRREFLRISFPAGYFREPEVDDLHGAVRQHVDVARLQISVYDASLMCV